MVLDEKVYEVMQEKGCATFFCSLQPLLLDAVPHLQPEAMWDDQDLRKKKKVYMSGKCLQSQTHPDEY